MTEPTTSLATLRRAIAKELNMEFFKRYKNGYLDVDSGDTDALIDADLTQKDKFWNGAWVYRVASQEASLITNFNATTNEISLEVPVTTFAAGDDYEIHNRWNAYDIHEAINAAIRDARRVFTETITDETLHVDIDTLEYDLTTLDRQPFLIHKVWLERSDSRYGTATNGTVNGIYVEEEDADGIDTTWKIEITGGTGAGQDRSISSIVQGYIIAVTPSWNTTPDTTSTYKIYNPNETPQDWYPWTALRYDSSKEFPDALYFSRRPVDFDGKTIRLEYSALPEELSAETDTTTIPMSYLVPAAISKLHGKKVGDTKVDRELHFAESRRYGEMAEAWLVRNAPHRPDTTILRQHSGAYQPDASNPLNWNG